MLDMLDIGYYAAVIIGYLFILCTGGYGERYSHRIKHLYFFVLHLFQLKFATYNIICGKFFCTTFISIKICHI